MPILILILQVAREDGTICRGPTNIGQAKLVRWIASTKGSESMQHGHGEALQRGLNRYSPNSDLSGATRLLRLHGVCGGYMSTLRKQFLGRTLCRGPTNIGQAGNNISVGQPV